MPASAPPPSIDPATLRPAHGIATALGIVCLLLPLYQARAEARFGEIWAFRAVGAVWPILGFLLSFALITSRETVPFLYFQF